MGRTHQRSRVPVRALLSAVAVVTAMLAPGWAAGAGDVSAAESAAATVGVFSNPFQEAGPACVTQPDGTQRCKPAGASVTVLADSRILYWNALEGTENIKLNTVAEYGDAAQDDQSRVLTLGPVPSWSTPSPSSGGAQGTPSYLVPGVTGSPSQDPNHGNDGALFCADQVQLADGEVLAVGGTDYYSEPQVPGTPYGVAELEGLKNTRIFDPATGTWSQTGSMSWGRWYPSLVTLAGGQVLVASGVTKLAKPVYLDRPTDSGTNVEETETYDPDTGTWTPNGASANHSLPLFPRLHLLPDGKVFYDGGGQTFNPFGQSYDEATWNIDAVYDPSSQSWTNVGVPGVGTLSPGFRGSAFSVMLPLRAPYTSASFLSAGGVLGVSPGSYIATATSEVNTVDTTKGDAVTTTATGMLTTPRWFSTGVALPDGTVMAFSGANRDEVVGPGTGNAILQAELFDPSTGTWTPMASAHHGRTYHNTAVLLPDGRVLVGGHAPIPTLYGSDRTLPGGFSQNQRDPSFEIYSPPYVFRPRPVVTDAPGSVGYGGTFTISTPQAGGVTHVMLVRNPSITHLVDGDQRTVELPVVARTATTVTVAAPPSGKVAPPGPYMLFVDTGKGRATTPSVSREVFVGANVPAWLTGRTAASSIPGTAVAGPTATGATGGGRAAAPGTRPALPDTGLVAAMPASTTASARAGRRLPPVVPVLPVAVVAAVAPLAFLLRRTVAGTRMRR